MSLAFAGLGQRERQVQECAAEKSMRLFSAASLWRDGVQTVLLAAGLAVGCGNRRLSVDRRELLGAGY